MALLSKKGLSNKKPPRTLLCQYKFLIYRDLPNNILFGYMGVIRFLISFLLWEMVALYLRLLLNLAIYNFGRIIKPLAGAGVLPMPNWMQNKRINCLYMPASLSKLMLFVAILNVLIVVRTVILFMKKSHPERNNLLRLWVPTKIDFPSRQLWLKFHSFNKNALQHLNSILDVAEFLHPSLKIH